MADLLYGRTRKYAKGRSKGDKRYLHRAVIYRVDKNQDETLKHTVQLKH